jgi:hypothetical protein
MRCPQCRFENREGIRFGEECGAKLELLWGRLRRCGPAWSEVLWQLWAGAVADRLGSAV